MATINIDLDAKLNDELLEDDVLQADEKPKRNSKDDLISKIINICADNDLVLGVSNTKLRRMTKDQLCKILAEKIELGVRGQMAAQVGAKANASDAVIALGALKMMHNIAANTAEKGLNMILPQYGYQLEGFTESLKDPAVDQAVDQCLAEIAADSDIMKHIESPYVRLAIAWGGALVTSLRKKRIIQRERYYASPMGPGPTPTENSLQLSVSRRPPAREVHGGQRPCKPDEKQV